MLSSVGRCAKQSCVRGTSLNYAVYFLKTKWTFNGLKLRITDFLNLKQLGEEVWLLTIENTFYQELAQKSGIKQLFYATNNKVPRQPITLNLIHLIIHYYS